MARASLQKLDCGWALLPDEKPGCGFAPCADESEDDCREPVVIFENVELQAVAEVRREGCNIYISVPETICAACRKPCRGDDDE